jgi:RNA polymerase sigma factor (sigma-70 family)
LLLYIYGTMKSDVDLLRQFAQAKDEASFAALVQRHIGFVFAVSVRRLRDPHLAKDATQAVFVALARKASAVAGCPSLIGWLHRSAVFETLNIMRARTNRLARETEAQRLGTTVAETRPQLVEIDTVLDEALHELPVNDREAIIARYFSGHSYAELGAELRLSENAARMRVDRALDKLRDNLANRGVTSTAAMLAGALPTYASINVPHGLAAGVTEAAVSSVTSATAAVATLTVMSTAKILTGVSIVALLCGVIYQYRRASELELRLAEVRSEHAMSGKQLLDLQRDVAAMKARAASSERSAIGAAITSAKTASQATAAEPAKASPIPGVTPKAPKGWFKNGSANDLYEVGVDENNAWGGMPSAYAQSTGEATGKFGGMMQTIAADTYANKRVRLNGWMKTEDANDGGGHLWLRIDGKEVGRSVAFDNMDGRAPKGTTDWQDYSIVLDVPADATKVNYGFFISGKGKMWVNGLTLTPVGTEVPTTNMVKPPSELPKTPVNLGFGPEKS